jgi:hypothetical protein
MISLKSRIRNDARRASLAGRPCLLQYHTPSDIQQLIDKSTFQRMYEEKWGGAPWMDDFENTDKVIILDNAPASSPSSSTSVTPSNSTTQSPVSSRRTTLEEGVMFLGDD